jgi:cysteinyl-tRNA synthetase
MDSPLKSYLEPLLVKKDTNLLNFKDTDASEVAGGAGPTLEVQAVQQSFATALDDDLNTPAALAGLGQVADDILAAATTGQEVTAAQQTLREMSQVFGLRLTADTPEARVVSGWNQHLRRFAPA